MSKEKKFKITADQLMQLENGFTLPKLKEWFPEVFVKKLEVGKWYKYPGYDRFICLVKENGQRLGTDVYGNWFDFADSIDEKGDYREATEQEVFEALKNEAVKRGFKEGVWVNRSLMHANTGTILIPTGEKYFFDYKFNIFYLNEREIFSNGVWAEIIPTKTIEQAEKELNCKIIN